MVIIAEVVAVKRSISCGERPIAFNRTPRYRWLPRIPRSPCEAVQGRIFACRVEIIIQIVVKSRASPYNFGILSSELLEYGNGISLGDAARRLHLLSCIVAAVSLACPRQLSLL